MTKTNELFRLNTIVTNKDEMHKISKELRALGNKTTSWWIDWARYTATPLQLQLVINSVTVTTPVTPRQYAVIHELMRRAGGE